MNTKNHSWGELEKIRVPSCNALCGWVHKWRCVSPPVCVLARPGRPLFYCAEHRDEAVRERREGEMINRIA